MGENSGKDGEQGPKIKASSVCSISSSSFSSSFFSFDDDKEVIRAKLYGHLL